MQYSATIGRGTNKPKRREGSQGNDERYPRFRCRHERLRTTEDRLRGAWNRRPNNNVTKPGTLSLVAIGTSGDPGRHASTRSPGTPGRPRRTELLTPPGKRSRIDAKGQPKRCLPGAATVAASDALPADAMGF